MYSPQYYHTSNHSQEHPHSVSVLSTFPLQRQGAWADDHPRQSSVDACGEAQQEWQYPTWPVRHFYPVLPSYASGGKSFIP